MAQTKPDLIPDDEWARMQNLIDPSVVSWQPYKGLAVKKDGTPFRVLDLRLWMGDDYQVVAHDLLKTQLEDAGAEYTLALVGVRRACASEHARGRNRYQGL